MLCIYDLKAIEVTLACRRLGIKVPDHLAIVGAGNEEFLCRMSNPPLCSVDTNKQEVGYQAAKLLDRLLHGGKAPAKPILITPAASWWFGSRRT